MNGLLRSHISPNDTTILTAIRMRLGAYRLPAYTMAVLLLLTAAHTEGVEPSLRTRILLEFGRLVPPQLEEPAVSLAGDLYALGYRASETGNYLAISQREYVYDKANKLSLDLYMPSAAPAPLPVVMVIHGGGWKYFTKAAVSGYARFLASHGFAAAAVDYRLSSTAKWPAQIEDIQRALKFLQSKGPELGIDPLRIAALGDSAGGHLAAMLGITSTGTPGRGLAGVVAYYGVYDLLPLVSFGAEAFENPINQLLGNTPDLIAACRQASPLHQLKSDAPPFLLIHGLNDSVVPVTQTAAFAAALRNAGVPVQTQYVKGADHLLLGIPGPIAPTLPVIDRLVLEFLRQRLSM